MYPDLFWLVEGLLKRTRVELEKARKDKCGARYLGTLTF